MLRCAYGTAMEDKALTAGKFTALSRGWSEREYRDPSGFMRRRAAMVREWGARLRPGDRILELGCGDGSLSCMLAAEGFDVTGVDISQGMVEEARHRAEREGVRARFEVADSDAFMAGESFDAVVSFMSAFFTYTENPAEFVARIAPRVRGKIMLDWNFRSPCTFVEAARVLERAGFGRVEWRPWRGPTLGRPLSLLLTLKRWHYTIHVKGEKVDEGARVVNDKDQAGAAVHEFRGNALPGGLLQRALIRFGQLTK